MTWRMEQARPSDQMAVAIKENGSITSRMEREWNAGPVEPAITDIITMVSGQARGGSAGRMALIMKGNGKTIVWRDKALWCGLMAESVKEIGETISYMGRVCLLGKMEDAMKGVTKKI